jgi:serine/threonine protein kinase
MASSSDPNVPDPLRTEIQSRHPGIADEIQGAIDTLRKLQDLAGPTTPRDLTEGDGSDPLQVGTSDSLSLPPSGSEESHATSASDEGSSQDSERQAPQLKIGESFGRYQIVRLLGKGAMGGVYLAYDSQLQRHVALKTPFLGNNLQTLKRFYREARAAAQLRSPHICPIYDVGQISGITYLSMAFIDGQPLSRVIAGRRLKDHREIARLTKKIASGLQKAHEKGIIHRDLKPDNIMIDSDGEPIVMDFGLARRVDDEIKVTMAGRIVGTPAYMSPEQMEGDPKKIGPATDIYSLGVVLYEMLTGQLPFRGTFTSLLRQITSDTLPPRPSALSPEVREGSPLEQTCLKMMAKVPARRFASMAEVARALEDAFAPSATVVARPSASKRVWSWLTRLFGGQTGAANSAKPPTSPSAEKTQAASGQRPPPGQENPQSATQTVDLPQKSDS